MASPRGGAGDAGDLLARGQTVLRQARTVVGLFGEKGSASLEPFELIKPASFYARWRGYEVFHNGDRGLQYVYDPKRNEYMAYESRMPNVSIVLLGYQGFFGPDPAMASLGPVARRVRFDGRECLQARVRGLSGPTDVYLDPRTGLVAGWSLQSGGRTLVRVYRGVRVNDPVPEAHRAWTPPPGAKRTQLPFPGSELGAKGAEEGKGWSGRWESNPRSQLGRLELYH